MKTLNIYPERCDGCGECESVCSLKHAGIKYPGRSCIRIIKESGNGDFFLPVTCSQCENPLCLPACPQKAIYRDPDLNRVMIDSDRCIGCQMCVSACPTGAMGFAKNRGKAFKCTLCGGDPACVQVCPQKALEYSEPEKMAYPQMARTALKMAGVGFRRGNG